MKTLTDAQKVKALRKVLAQVQKKHLYFPDSDAREYCPCCGRSPYNVVPHDETCLVVAVAKVLKDTA